MALTTRIILFIFFTLLFFHFSPAQNNEVKPPEPSVNISFAQSKMEIGDSLRIVLQVSNGSAYTLTNLKFEMDAPASLKLKDSSGEAQYVLFDSIPAYSAFKNNRVFIHAGAGQVGDINLVFTLSYQWRNGKKLYSGQAIVEKPIKLGFFGTDNVVGIPLAFAQFIVPGLAFLLVLRLLNILSKDRFETDEKLVVGVMISVVCVLAINFLANNINWVRQLGISSTVSTRNIFFQAVSGVVVALVVAGAWRGWHRWHNWKDKRWDLTGGEKPVILVYNSLQLNDYTGKARQITCKDGTVYRGAHYFETSAGHVLIGGFQLEKKELAEDQVQQLKKLYEGNNLKRDKDSIIKAINICGGRKKAVITIYNLIKEIKTGGEPAYKGSFYTVATDQFKQVEEVVDDSMPLLVVS